MHRLSSKVNISHIKNLCLPAQVIKIYQHTLAFKARDQKAHFKNVLGAFVSFPTVETAKCLYMSEITREAD